MNIEDKRVLFTAIHSSNRLQNYRRLAGQSIKPIGYFSDTSVSEWYVETKQCELLLKRKRFVVNGSKFTFKKNLAVTMQSTHSKSSNKEASLHASSIAASHIPALMSIPNELMASNETESQQLDSLAQSSPQDIRRFAKQTTFSMTDLHRHDEQEWKSDENSHVTCITNQRDEMNALMVYFMNIPNLTLKILISNVVLWNF